MLSPASSINPEQIAQAGLIAFFNISKDWGLTTAQEQIILGNPARATFFKCVRATFLCNGYL